MIQLFSWLRSLPAAGGEMTGGAWALSALVVGLAVGAARSLVGAYLIGAHEVGTFGIALLVLAMADALTASGAETALITHPGDAEVDLDLIFTLRLGQGVVGTLLLWFGAPVAGDFFDSADLPELIRALAAVPLLRGVANPAAILLVRRSEFRRVFWWGLPELAAGAVLVIIVGVLRHDAWAPTAALIGAQVVSTTASYVVAPRVPRLAARGAGVSRLLHFGRWTQATRVLMFVSLYLDNAAVGKFLGASALGLYQIAFRIAEIPIATVGRAAAQVMLPALTRLRAQPHLLRREYLRTLRSVLAVNVVLALGIVVAANPLIPSLLGPQWLPAVPVAQILAVAMVLRNAMMLANQLIYSIERPRLAFAVNAVRVAVLAVTLYPLLRLLGTPGVALSVLLSNLAGVLCSITATRACLGVRLAGDPAGM